MIENLIDQVRNEGFTDIKTSKFVDGHSLQVRVPLASDAVPWQPSRVTSDWQRGSVGITRDLASGGAKIGSSLFLALGDVSDRKGALTPVGRILDLSESSLVRVEEALRGGGVQQVNLVLAYPESLIPSVVRQEIDGRKSNPSETPAETGAAEKGTGTPASSASSSREQQEEAPSQLILRLDGASGDWERVVEGRATAIADLPSYLKKMVELKKLEASGGSAAPFSVILEVPGGVPTSNMKMVVKMLQSLGIQDLSFRNSDTATPVARIDPVTGKLNQPKLQGIKPREFAEPISKARPVESSLITPDPNAEPLPRVRVKTNRGTFVIELYEDDAPNTVANFIHLVESGFYVGQIFNRKSSNPSNKGFIQGGSPDGTRKGGPGYMIMDELNNRRNIKGAVAMARKHTVPNTAGSQFFICLDNQPQLDGIYTVFAVVVEGFKWVETFEVGTVLEDLQVIGKRDHEYTPRTNPL